MTAWTPLNTLLVVCISAVVVSLCLGRVAVALIEAWHGNSAAANASLDAIESAAQKAAAEAVSKFFLAHPPPAAADADHRRAAGRTETAPIPSANVTVTDG